MKKPDVELVATIVVIAVLIYFAVGTVGIFKAKGPNSTGPQPGAQ